MKGDLTAETDTRHDTGTARADSTERSWRSLRLGAARAWRVLAAALAGALLFALCAQIPAAHAVDIGGLDAAYVQGLHDPERAGQPGERPYLAGSDGSARWTRAVSYLLFPQMGAPGELTLRLRGWRAQGSPPELLVLAGGTEIGRIRTSGDWEEHRFTIASGLLRPSDVVVELRADTVRPAGSNSGAIGVLLDSANYRTASPAIPYPWQVAYGALAAGLLWTLVRGQQTRSNDQQRDARLTGLLPFLLGMALLTLAYLLLYRLQPPYPYPLRRLPQVVCALLAALVALRFGPRLLVRAPALADIAALGGIGAWAVALLVTGQQHLVLSVPGVEKDFRVFATRAFELGEVFRADGFYNLGYPLLLWLVTPLAQGNPFLAARAISALSGALLLGATWWLARRTAGPLPALLALCALALSPLVVQYGLYVGSDMPFAALCALALAVLLRHATNRGPQTTDHGPRTTDHGPRRALVVTAQSSLFGPSSAIFLAGLAAGAAFLMRHPGLLLLPVGLLAVALGAGDRRAKVRGATIFTLAFAMAILPQVAVNLRDTGQPLYSQQAKNIWLAVYGDGDWARWGETSDSVTLAAVIAQDPARFLGSWWANVRAFFGTGAEDTSEFGRALQLRLLAFPANWLAVAGLAYFGFRTIDVGLRRRSRVPETSLPSAATVLLTWVVLYVAAVSVGLSLPRFFLPLAPAYAVAAGWAVIWLTRRWARSAEGQARGVILAGAALLALMWGGLGNGINYVLRVQPDAASPGQPPEAMAAAELVTRTLGRDERVVVRAAPDDEPGLTLSKYSAVAHLAVPPPSTDAAEALRATGAGYLLWSSELGLAPDVGERVGAAGRYILIRLEKR
ncbi:MAG: hypothetical protein RLZZ387_2236 [Chloroflexota bacterium]